jgi:hypothetical protein
VTIKPTTTAPPDAVLVLDRKGRDEELSFRPGDLVEVTSTDLQLHGRPGFLGTAGAPDGLELPVTWLGTGPTARDDLGRVPIVRRWEGGPTPASAAADGTELEDGIVVRFPAGGTAVTGDYWLIPARTVRLAHGIDALSGTIDWPQDSGGDGLPQDPFGVRHHVAPLAVLERRGQLWRRESDCRRLFPALTGLVSIDLVGGDGQQAMPGDALPEPVRVAVRNGGLPVPDARVRFRCPGGELALDEPPTGPPPPAAPASVEAVTGADGVARVFWRLDPDGATTQTLIAQRLDDRLDPTDVRVTVNARLSVASQVQWEPTCAGFADTRTVQDALGQLTTTRELRLLGGEGQHVSRAGDVLPRPVRVVVDSPCQPVARVSVLAVASGKAGLVALAKEGAPTPATLSGTPATSDAVVETGADGVAAFFWQPAFGDGSSDVLDIAVKGEDDAPIRVNAQLLPESGGGGGRTRGVHITGLRFPQMQDPNNEFRNDTLVTPAQLAGGISVDLDGPVVVQSAARKPVVHVVLYLPFPLAGDGPIGRHGVELEADTNADGPLIVWSPQRETGRWLQGLDIQGQPIPGRFIVDGWAIVYEKNPEQHLNGHARAVVGPDGRTDLRLPTDDEVTGGTFVQWFRLGEGRDPGRERIIAVPDLARMTRARAERVLAESGLVLGETVEESSEVVRRNSVVRTEPAAGEELPVGSTVFVVVSTGRP